MHELSIAMELLEIVGREAMKHGAKKVNSLTLKIGDLSGIETSSLIFSFEAVRGENPITRNAELIVERIPVRISCRPCGRDFQGDGYMVVCPNCEGYDTRLLEGDELTIKEMDID